MGSRRRSKGSGLFCEARAATCRSDGIADVKKSASYIIPRADEPPVHHLLLLPGFFNSRSCSFTFPSSSSLPCSCFSSFLMAVSSLKGRKLIKTLIGYP